MISSNQGLSLQGTDPFSSHVEEREGQLCRSKILMSRKGPFKELATDVLYQRMLHVHPWGIWSNRSCSLTKQNLISAGTFLCKDIGLCTDWILEDKKIHWAPCHETSTRWFPSHQWTAIGHWFHCRNPWVWSKVKEKQITSACWAGEIPTTSSFTWMEPILQQISGSVFTVEATSIVLYDVAAGQDM